MKLSLLYAVEEEGGVDLSPAIYDLSIDRLFELVIPDVKTRAYFLKIIASPCTHVDNAIYRREILDDLLEIPSLFDRLTSLFQRYYEVKKEWAEGRSKMFTAKRASESNAMSQFLSAASGLQLTAFYLKKVLVFIKTISDEFSRYELRSEGFIGVRDAARQLVRNPAYPKLIALCETYESFTPTTASFDVDIALDEMMRLDEMKIRFSSEIFDTRDSKPSGEGSLMKRLFGKNQHGRENEKKADVNPADKASYKPVGALKLNVYMDEMYSVLASAMNDMSNMMNGILTGVYDIFFGLRGELDFYRAAVEYVRFTEDKSIPLCKPELLPPDANILSISGLRDALLCFTGKSAKNVVPNDVSLTEESDGILIRGDNNTGKTVYLRSAGTAQLLGQAGLPITANTAKISLRDKLLTQFASAEKDFTVGNTAGRFEEEVAKLAEIVENSTPNTLVLLNETFQTTAYSEGADGIYPILRYLSRHGVKWIFITHLHQLFALTKNDNVVNMKTLAGYKLQVTASPDSDELSSLASPSV